MARQTLENLDAVHHLIARQVISLDGDQATAAANTQGTHLLANAFGGPMWTVGGRHDYQLNGRPMAGGSPAHVHHPWATGNAHILTLAAAGRRP